MVMRSFLRRFRSFSPCLQYSGIESVLMEISSKRTVYGALGNWDPVRSQELRAHLNIGIKICGMLLSRLSKDNYSSFLLAASCLVMQTAKRMTRKLCHYNNINFNFSHTKYVDSQVLLWKTTIWKICPHITSLCGVFPNELLSSEPYPLLSHIFFARH